MPITLDIGGEGRHAGAINLNLSRQKTVGTGRGEPIPHLLVARADAIPLADCSVERVIVERTPLGRGAMAEIARIIAPGGTVLLRHVPLPNTDRHQIARELIAGRVECTRYQIGRQWVQETRIEIPISPTVIKA